MDSSDMHRTAEPLSLYLHIPFCDHKCAYCDFNSYAGLERMIPAFTDALVHELAIWAPDVAGRPVSTVFVGGGTPSLMPLPAMARVLDAIRAHYALAPDAEISLEANPGTVDEPYLAGLRALGVNRLSIGVQSLDDRELRARPWRRTRRRARPASRTSTSTSSSASPGRRSPAGRATCGVRSRSGRSI